MLFLTLDPLLPSQFLILKLLFHHQLLSQVDLLSHHYTAHLHILLLTYSVFSYLSKIPYRNVPFTVKVSDM